MAKVLFIFIAIIAVISLILIKYMFNYYCELQMMKSVGYAANLANQNAINSDKLSQLNAIKKFGNIGTKHFDQITHEVNIRQIDYRIHSDNSLKGIRHLAY